MAQNFIVWGVGELGQFFGGAALRLGFRVTGIRRNDDYASILRAVGPCPLLISVGEDDLDNVLACVPAEFADKLILVQNELFPSAWLQHPQIGSPTICVVWAVVKRLASALVSPHPAQISGPLADLTARLHHTLGVDCRLLPHPHEALMLKYSYILTINTLGLRRDTSVGEWAHDDHKLEVMSLAGDAATLAAALAGVDAAEVDTGAMAARVRAIMQVPTVAGYRAMGRTAQRRLERARVKAAALGSLPLLPSLLASRDT